MAGHRGLVGSAILRLLKEKGYTNIVVRTHSEVDLTDPLAVDTFFRDERPGYVFLAAAKVGGIVANATFPADFICQNLSIQNNVIQASHRYEVRRLLFLGSSCIYPKHADQPIRESYLMTGPLEQTNSAYAVAKIAGIEMCWAFNRQHGCRFLPVMPSNLYGTGDNFDLVHSHVLPAMIRKFHLAKCVAEGRLADVSKDERRFGTIPGDIRERLGIVEKRDGFRKIAEPAVLLWGTGKPKREFLYVDDLARACLFLMEQDLPKESSPLYNIGTGQDQSVRELSETVKKSVGFRGLVKWDDGKPDGTARKLLDVSKMTGLGWKPKTSLVEGIGKTYEWYVRELEKA